MRPFDTVRSREIHNEIIRKSLHFLIALCPPLAAVNRLVTGLALLAGILIYSVMEGLRLSGVNVPLVSALTRMASRPREKDRFVPGPVTLALGALLALALFPPPTAAIGIYALAFGDGCAGLAGTLFGRRRLLFGKTVEGSFACFAAVFTAAWLASRSCGVSLVAAVTAAAVEALPLEHFDNIALPLAVGFVVWLFG